MVALLRKRRQAQAIEYDGMIERLLALKTSTRNDGGQVLIETEYEEQRQWLQEGKTPARVKLAAFSS
jgi:hypothetical protein